LACSSYIGYLVVGATTAGFQLMQFNLMLQLAPADLRPAYVAVFIALTSLMTAAGPVLGGNCSNTLRCKSAMSLAAR